MESDTRQPARTVAYLLVCVLLVVACMLAVAPILSSRFFAKEMSETRAFDADAWRRAEQIDRYRTVRGAMVDDLLSNHDFVGWAKADVVGLLGEPDKLPPENDIANSGDLVYYLGLDPEQASPVAIPCVFQETRSKG